MIQPTVHADHRSEHTNVPAWDMIWCWYLRYVWIDEEIDKTNQQFFEKTLGVQSFITRGQLKSSAYGTDSRCGQIKLAKTERFV